MLTLVNANEDVDNYFEGIPEEERKSLKTLQCKLAAEIIERSNMQKRC